MDNAPASGAGDHGFESHRARFSIGFFLLCYGGLFGVVFGVVFLFLVFFMVFLGVVLLLNS